MNAIERMIRNWLLLCFSPLGAFLIGATVNAQTGVRFPLAHWERALVGDDITPISLGIGLDRDLGERLSSSVEFTMLYRNLLGDLESADPLEVESQGWTGYFEVQRKGLSFTYRSMYFFNNSAEGFYWGTAIGVRRVGVDLRLTSALDGNFTSGLSPFRDNYSARCTTFPIGIRFGMRSGLDGGFSDLYLGLGYQSGSGKDLFSAPELQNAELDLAALTWTFGYAYGIGW